MHTRRFHTKHFFFLRLCSTLFILISLLFFVGCSDEDTEKQKQKQEIYSFKDTAKQNEVTLTLHKINEDMHIKIATQDSVNMLHEKKAKIIALFPKECTACMPTLIHINNLLSHTQGLQVFVLSHNAIQKTPREFPVTLNKEITNLIDSNTKLDIFLDSLKRALNIEIKDYNAPLFLLVSPENKILQSIEGAVLEEIFEQQITQILNANNTESKKDSKIEATAQPNNTLSTTAPSSTTTLQNKQTHTTQGTP